MTEADVERLGTLIDLPIPAEDRAAVAAALTVLLRAAEQVLDFPLPEDIHPAPVFRP